ncbi:MAG: Ribonuclease protein component [Ignavibacteria bacterium]|nr:Ribonuclease protein component [Ignavibacteria bacterium]
MKLLPIKGFDAYSEAYKEGKKFELSTAKASVTFRMPNEVLFERQNNDDNVYYGVTIGKKTAKRAVIRNRVKRLLRESLRKSIKIDIRNGEICPFLKIIIIWKRTPLHPKLISLKDVLPVVQNIVKNAVSYYNNQQKSRLSY